MSTSSRRVGWLQWLFDPFTYVAGGRALMFGLAAILAAGLIGSLSNSHFDGVLDLHSGRPAPLWFFLSEGLIDWLSLTVVLLAFGKILSKTQFRAIDLVGTQAMARWPTILTAVAALPDGVRAVGAYFLDSLRGLPVTPLTATDLAGFAVSTLVTFLVIIWFVVLAYKSYAVSCNLRGGKAIGSFIVGILIAEVLSKLAMLLMVALS